MMKALGRINFLSTALMSIAIGFVGYATTESVQAQSTSNNIITSTQKFNPHDEAKRRLVLKFYQALNTGNTALLDEVLAYNWVDEPTWPGLPPGREGGKQLVRLFRAAFPDFSVQVKDVIIDGNKVVVRANGYGTHRGKFLGIPATGKRVQLTAIDIHYIRNNRIAKTWNLQNLLSVVQQLGWTIQPRQ